MQNVNDIRDGHKIKAGYIVYYYDCVSSTNDVAKDFAKDERDRIVIVAETQRCGRGRLCRRWVSPRGGLWFTVILRPPMGPHETARLTLLMSSAIALALKDKFSLDVEVKRPNDVLINGSRRRINPLNCTSFF